MKLVPESEGEVADMLRESIAGKRRCEIIGNGTKRGLGPKRDADDVLDLSRLSGVTRYEPGELVITARAGTPLAEIAAALAGHSQKLGFDPADWGPLYGAAPAAGTIGGVVSADCCGSARLRHGAVRDHLLGFRAVNGFGEIYKAGSHVVKNVTGFDLPKLVCGAMGTLGPLTELTLRLVPRAACSLTLVARDIDAEAGCAVLRRVWASPLEATGLAFVPGTTALPALVDPGRGVAMIRFEGSAAALAEKRAALGSLLPRLGLDACAAGDTAFAGLGNGDAFAGRDEDLWRVFVPPSETARCAAALASPRWYADWAGGVIWIETGAGHAVHEIAARFGGHARRMRDRTDAPDTTVGTTVGTPPADRVRDALAARVRDAFDPHGLFDPGRVGREA